MNLLRKFQVEIVIGKLSFKEKADIYNESHGYQDVPQGRDTESDTQEHTSRYDDNMKLCS